MNKKKLYNKMFKLHRKNLVCLAKNSTPFQYDDAVEMFIENLRFMRDYYEIGYNVQAMERIEEDPVLYKGKMTRFESLQLALDEYDSIDSCYSKYIAHNDNGKTEYKIDNDYRKSYEALQKERDEHKRKFREIIDEYLKEWWD